MRILVTGGSGLLGYKLVSELLSRDHSVIAIYNTGKILIKNSNVKWVKIDISNKLMIEDLILKEKPDVIIHAAAYTDVDGCEINKEYAWKVNVEATRSIVRAARVVRPYTIYVSSVTGDTPVLVKKKKCSTIKLMTIEDLYRCKDPWKYEVLTLSDDYKLKFESIGMITAHPAKEIYEIHYEGGGVIRTSGNHSVYVFTKKGIATKAVSELKPGDFLVTLCGVIKEKRKIKTFNLIKIAKERYRAYRRKSIRLKKRYMKNLLRGFNRKIIRVTEDLMWLFGIYLAEGHSSNTEKERIRRLHKVTFTTTNRALAQRIVNAIKKTFNVNVHLSERKDGSIHIEVGRYIIYKLFEEFGHVARDKRIPNWLWLSSKAHIKALLNGYLEDGSIRRNYEVIYYSINRNLITQLLWLSRINGIPCRIHSVLQKNVKGVFQKEPKDILVYELVIPSYVHASNLKSRPPSCLCLPSETLGIKVDDKGRRLSNLVSKRKALRLIKSSSSVINKLLNSDIGVARVKKVIRIELKKPILLYDITIPGNPRFFGGNVPILLHNTDYIFDGVKGKYVEDDAPNPINYYGLTKLVAEELVKSSDLLYAVVRPSAIYGVGPGKLNFATFIASRLRGGFQVRALVDQYVSPTLNTLLAKVLAEIVEMKPLGVFHVGGERMSRFDFALKIAEALNLPRELIVPAKMEEMNWKARRPRDSSLNTSKARRIFKTKFFDNNYAIKLFAQEYFSYMKGHG